MGPSQAQARHRCDQIREWISIGLDSDLSRIEQALVNRHLTVCAECTSFAHDVQAFTGALRATELELLERPISLPQRTRRVSVRSFQVGVAAAVALAAVGVASLSSALGQDQIGSKINPAVSGIRYKDQMRTRQLQQLTEQVAQTLPRPVGRQPV
jgi:predicted anti-sigma-YlaC factor YlaD